VDATVKQTALRFLATERKERQLKVQSIRKPFGDNLTKALEGPSLRTRAGDRSDRCTGRTGPIKFAAKLRVQLRPGQSRPLFFCFVG